MTDEPTNAELETRDSSNDAPGADETVVVGTFYHSLDAAVITISLSETVVTATALTIFAKAFLETLGRRAGEGAANLLDRVRVKVHKKSDADEYHLGVDGGAAATVVVTEDLPDEARLALLDLDVTADELRGKLLRWDSATSAWRPSDD